MTKNEILDYIMSTPENTNRQILGYMLDELEGEGEGGSFPFPIYECNLISDVDSTLAITPFPDETSTLICLDINGNYYAIVDFSYQPTKGFIITPTAIGEINGVSDSEDRVLISYKTWAKQK